MYLGLDGSGVPVRPAEVEGRRGRQPDGSAKTREVKLATLWTAETRDKAPSCAAILPVPEGVQSRQEWTSTLCGFW